MDRVMRASRVRRCASRGGPGYIEIVHVSLPIRTSSVGAALCALDREPGRNPFEIPAVQTPRLEAARTEDVHGVIGIDAIGTAAARDDLLALGDLLEPALELTDRNAHRARHVSGRI